MAQLVRGEAAPNASLRCDTAEVVARGSGCPGSPARLAVDHAEQRAHRHLDPAGAPGPELVETRFIHADLAPLAALPLADEDRAAAWVKVWFGQRHRLADSEPGPPE